MNSCFHPRNLQDINFAECQPLRISERGVNHVSDVLPVAASLVVARYFPYLLPSLFGNYFD